MSYVKICWIYLSAIVFFGESNAYQHTCRSPTNQSILVNTRGYANTVRSTNSSKLRIDLHYTQHIAQLSSFESLKSTLIEPAVNFWSEALSARVPLQEDYRILRPCVQNQYVIKNDPDGIPHFYCTIGCTSSPICIDEQIPDKYLSACREIVNDQPEVTIPEGLGYAGNDMVFIVDAKATSDCLGGTLAYASACRIESGLDRPVLGYVNLCPHSLKLTYPEVEISYSTVVHELAHGLGFNPVLYAFMRDENGIPRTSRNPSTGLPSLGKNERGIFIPDSNTVSTIARKWMSSQGVFKRWVTVLKTPNVLKAARKHFSCPTLEGVDLENQGGAGTDSAHFEKRVVQDEIMAGSIGKHGFVSILTLSYFLDTG
ncbi:hypothetical protein EG68_09422 [Paragonimus skrjabini miyazakii]|uniref:Leishmanolysin-like peptidase n=1 Tax=Paragonimus skrjabini miyazakii TaxID=59628 RepID=A0A8S9YCN8_9TREM|nr:hypothetical protein EG68_09422 [Paragonimus skrjabini miyazakii]